MISGASYGQACGSAKYPLHFLDLENNGHSTIQIDFYDVKDIDAAKAEINLRELRYGIPITENFAKSLGYNPGQKVKDEPILRWELHENRGYGHKILFQTFELYTRYLIMRVIKDGRQYFLLGDFFGGCGRSATFSFYNGQIKKIQNSSIPPKDPDHLLHYNCVNCDDLDESILIVYDQGDLNEKGEIDFGLRVPLLQLPLGGNYLGEIEYLEIEGGQFVYIRQDHTSGNSSAKLYRYTRNPRALKEVEVVYNKTKLPDSLSAFKGYDLGLSDDKTQFTSGSLVRSETSGQKYYFTRYLGLVEDEEGVFRLIEQRSTLEPNYD